MCVGFKLQRPVGVRNPEVSLKSSSFRLVSIVRGVKERGEGLKQPELEGRKVSLHSAASGKQRPLVTQFESSLKAPPFCRRAVLHAFPPSFLSCGILQLDLQLSMCVCECLCLESHVPSVTHRGPKSFQFKNNTKNIFHSPLRRPQPRPRNDPPRKTFKGHHIIFSRLFAACHKSTGFQSSAKGSFANLYKHLPNSCCDALTGQCLRK